MKTLILLQRRACISNFICILFYTRRTALYGEYNFFPGAMRWLALILSFHTPYLCIMWRIYPTGLISAIFLSKNAMKRPIRMGINMPRMDCWNPALLKTTISIDTKTTTMARSSAGSPKNSSGVFNALGTRNRIPDARLLGYRAGSSPGFDAWKQ